MGIREKLNEKRAVTIPVAIGLIVLTLGFLIWHFVSSRLPAGPLPAQIYFSDDDGATWFLADAAKVPPFTDDHGKEAFRVALFRCGEGGKPFVGHLEGYDPPEKQKIEEYIRAGKNPIELALTAQRRPYRGLTKIKRPKEKNWHKLIPGDLKSEEEYRDELVPVCPDGKPGQIQPIFPGDPKAP